MPRLFQTQQFRVLIGLAIVVLLFFRAIVFQAEALHGGDLVNHFIPNKQFLRESVAQGHLPLWNPYLFSGQPFVANIQTGVFYPPAWLCLIVPVSYAFSLLMVLHFYFAAVGMFCFARLFFARSSPAVLAAAVFVFSGFLVTHLYGGHVLLIFAASWVPLIFYFAERLYRERTTKYALFLSVALAMQMLSGSPQVVLYSVATLAMFVIFQIVWRTKETAQNEQGQLRWGRLDILKQVVLAVMLAGGVAAVQIVPSVEFTHYAAARSQGASWEYVTKDSLEPRYLMTFAAPDFFYDPTMEGLYWGGRQGYWEINAYLGILPLMLALLPLFFVGRRWRTRLDAECAGQPTSVYRSRLFYFSVVGSVVFLWLAFGKSSLLFRLVYLAVPGFKYFRVPARWLLFYTFCMSLLAAFGFEIAQSVFNGSNRRAQRRFVLAIISIAAAIIALCLLGLIDIRGTMTFFKIQEMRPQDSFAAPSPYLLELVDAARKSLFLTIVLVAVSAAALLLFRINRIPRAAIVVTVFVVIAFDLWSYGAKFLKTVPEAQFRRSFYPETELVRFLKENAPDSRVTYLDDVFYWYNDQNQIELLPNRGMMHHLYDARGYDPLLLESYLEYFNAISFEPLEEEWGTFVSLQDIKNPKLLSLLNVRYVFTYKGLAVPGFRLAKRLAFGLNVYENQNARGWAFLAKSLDARSLSRQRIFGILSHPQFDSLHYVLAEGSNSYGKGSFAPADQEQVSAVTRSADESGYRISVRDSDILVFSDPYYPGWRVLVDGKREHVVRVNNALSGVFVPPGVHTVVKTFDPMSFKVGGLISLICLFGLVAGIVLSIKAHRTRMESIVRTEGTSGSRPRGVAL